MSFDAHKNLAISAVTTAPSPATSGTTLTVGAGEGARFPAAPFNATVWPMDMAPTPATAEVVRVTAIAGDVLTIARAQEGTTGRAIVAGDLIAATITAKTITDIESGVNFPLINTAGNVDCGNVTAANQFVAARYAFHAGSEIRAMGDGVIKISNAGQTDLDRLQFGGTTSAFPALKRSGAGLAVRTADDSGPAVLSAAEFVGAGMRTDTTDGADTKFVTITGGGALGPDRGGYIQAHGNEHATLPGRLSLITGAVATGAIEFYTGPTTAIRGVMHPSGGFSWGGTGDPGAGVFLVGTYGGQSGFITPGGYFQSGILAATATHFGFYNNAGGVGSITSTAAGTQYNTTSDARLKTPLSRHTDPSVLRKTIIHNFVWTADGTPGRGVFAQEAYGVLPGAVSVGSDAMDDEGRLTHPWGVDYSKYVPDLITGWQAHEAQHRENLNDLNEFHIRLTSAEQDLRELRRQLAPRVGMVQRIRTALATAGNFITGIWRIPRCV